MEQYKLISLISILYYIVIYTCGVFCVELNKLQSLTSLKLNHPNVYNDYRDYKIRSKRELEDINVITTSKDFTKRIRKSRGISGSNRHLRLGDAHQVANYFLTNGPSKGHAHFVKERNCESDNNENNVNEISNPNNGSNTDLSTNKQDLNTTLSDSIVGAVHIPPLHLPHSNLNSVIHPTLNTLSRLPHLLLGNNLLHSVMHPNLHPHINALHDIPSNLIKTASLPVTGLMQARSELQNMFHPHGPLLGSVNKALKHAKVRKNVKNNFTYPTGSHPPIVGLAPIGFHNNVPLSNVIHSHLPIPHPQPNGYIVKYVPHDKQTVPLSPFNGSSQIQSSNYGDNNSNIQQDSTSSTNS